MVFKHGNRRLKLTPGAGLKEIFLKIGFKISKNTQAPETGAYPGGMHRMHVHPPLPPCASPPSQPERLVVMRGGGGRSAKNVHPPRQNPRYVPVPKYYTT
jgi:hypothetical protein